MRVTEHGAYFDGNPEGPKMRVHGIGKQLDLLGRVLQDAPHLRERFVLATKGGQHRHRDPLIARVAARDARDSC